jgi:hypothetical protein
LKALRPPGHPSIKKASRELREAAYLMMDRYLQENASSVFSCDASSPSCILHPGKHCKVAAPRTTSTVDDEEDAVGGLGNNKRPRQQASKQPRKLDGLLKDLDAEIDAEQLASRLTHTIAGAMCTPWTCYGNRQGLGDPASEPWFIWINEQVALLPDFVTLENSPLFPLKALFSKRMEKTHVIIPIIIGPEDSKPKYDFVFCVVFLDPRRKANTKLSYY